MARLGGMSTESFSSARECLSAASVGLAAILRDQKTMPGSSARAPVLLGLSSQTTPAATRSLSNSPVRSLASSPIDSSGVLDADDADDYKEEDIYGADVRESRNSQSLKDHRGLLRSGSAHGFDVRNHGYEPTFRHGFSHAHTHAHNHQQRHSRAHHDVHKQQMYSAVDGVASRPARHHLVEKGTGLSEYAIATSAASIRLSPLSKVSHDSQPLHIPAAGKALTPSWTIPTRAKPRRYGDAIRDSTEHQSAPVNVPNWSKILKQPAASGASSSDGVGKFGEDADSEKLPPHEFLAREYAQSQRMTSSVCEGHGRTLKGRDMRRVRNAVWRETGFVD